MFLYFLFLFLILSFSNFYVVWILIEFNFIFFLLFSLLTFVKNYGLIIYYFLQGFLSMLLFISFHFFISNLLFFIFLMKLGLFPFFYWVIIVSLKVDILLNIFILGLQKISMFWLFWLTIPYDSIILLLIFYLGLFFVFFSLVSIADLWLLIVYSSVVRTSFLVVSMGAGYFWLAFFFYCFVLILILVLIKFSFSYLHIVIVVYFFLSIPPFILFFFKLYVVFGLLWYTKLVLFFFIFDVCILLYYFTLIFIKFILFEFSLSLILVNFLIGFICLFFRNCVALVIFY